MLHCSQVEKAHADRLSRAAGYGLSRTALLLVCMWVGGIASGGRCNAGEDWPMWRADASRSATTVNHLPAELKPLWKRAFPKRSQAWDDPLNLDLMSYDRVFEPIVMDGKLFIGFNDQDKLLALDTVTGNQLWSFFAEAPIRLPPVGYRGRIYVCSDDGYLYCLDAADGHLIWKFSGAPNAQHAIGNRRLTSAWPARGGPVVFDGQVYFAASIWPFMGTFLYALDADSGRVTWVNDNTGAQYIKQPHSAPSFAGVAPQGALVATEDCLIVPGGRSVPAVFDRRDGRLKYFEINAGGKGTGGSFVTADESHFFVHTREKGTRAFSLETGLKTAFMPNEPVLAQGRLYSAEVDKGADVIRAYAAPGADGKPPEILWQLQVSGSGDLILADKFLVAAGAQQISVIDIGDPAVSLPTATHSSPQVVQSIDVQEDIARLVVADHKLFAVTSEGAILAYGLPPAAQDAGDAGPSSAGPRAAGLTSSGDAGSRDSSPDAANRSIATSLLASGAAEGYGFWFGDASHAWLAALCDQSPFEQLAVVDRDRSRVDALRRQLDAAQQYGRITAHVAAPAEFRAPDYVANMVFVAPDVVQSADDASLAAIYRCVRPYGGLMHLLGPPNEELLQRLSALELEQAELQVGEHSLIIRRAGALPGAADWTHQYGDVANTLKSNDHRVKLPLGILWFGGSSNMDVLPRHGHGPPEQVIGGRLFIQGMNSLSARDVYTGRVLWKREFQDLGTFDVYYDRTYEDTPLDPKYNQVHIPGANGRGTNFVATPDRLYILEGSTCHILDPATGLDLQQITLPEDDTQQSPQWGYIGIYEDVLIAGYGFADYARRMNLQFESDKALSASRAGFGSKSLDRAASRGLIGYDRHSGQLLWQVQATHSFWHNAIVAGGDRIYCLDRNPSEIENAMRRRGLAMPDSYRILCLNYRTGETLWEVKHGIFGSWLGYSAQHDLLLQAGAQASDRLAAEVGQGMSVYQAADGQLKWSKESLKYTGPCILHNDLIITNANSYTESAGAYNLLTGEQKMTENPLTAELEPWRLTRAYGCNNIIASEHLLTFRSGAAGYYDLLSDAGTGNLGGFKSGCTSNLVVAGGVLNAPDYTRTCSCAYQNQTSLALIHMPDVEVWSVHPLVSATTADAPIQVLGINFGAAGDRRDEDGHLWIEYPTRTGDDSPVPVQMNAEASVYQHHSSAYADVPPAWIYASGVDHLLELSIGLERSAANPGDADLPSDAAQGDSAAESEKNDQSQSELNDRDQEIAQPTQSFFDVQLYFASSRDNASERIFDIYCQGELLQEKVRIPASPGEGPQAAFQLRFDGIEVNDALTLKFVPHLGTPRLSGALLLRSKARHTRVLPAQD